MRLQNIRILFLMELKKLWNDKLELLILIFGAILLCLAFGYVAYSSPGDMDIAVYVDTYAKPGLFPHGETADILTDLQESPYFSLTAASSRREALQRLNGQKSRAAVILEEDAAGLAHVRVTLDATDLTIQQIVHSELLRILQTQGIPSTLEPPRAPGLPENALTPLALSLTTNESQKTKLFDATASPFMVLIILGVCLLTSVTALTSERTIGTFERVFAIPFKRSEILISKALARSMVAVAVSAIILLTLRLVFDIAMARPGLAMLAAVLIGINGVAFGLLISAITRIELESVSLGITSWFLFITLMGFMWPLETMHPWFQSIAFFTPFFHGVYAMRHINLLGWDLYQVLPSFAWLSGFILLQLVLSTLLLKREIN